MAKSKWPDGELETQANVDAAAKVGARKLRTKPAAPAAATEVAESRDEKPGKRVTRRAGDAKESSRRAAKGADAIAAKRTGERLDGTPDSAAAKTSSTAPSLSPRAPARDAADGRVSKTRRDRSKTRRDPADVTAGRRRAIPVDDATPLALRLATGDAGLATAALAEVVVYDLADLKNGGRLAPIDPATPAYRDIFDLTTALLTFYAQQFGRNSYDGGGARLAIILNDILTGGSFHDDDAECLRFSESWEGKRNDGASFRFDGIPRAPEYLAHEFQHAVTCACAPGLYAKTDGGAMHESLSDVFAIAFRHWRARKQGATPIDWRFGSRTAKIVLPGGGYKEVCTRNLDLPRDSDAWERGYADLGAARANNAEKYPLSLVASHAFRRVTARLGETQDPAKAIDEAARVWYAALASDDMKNVHSIEAFATLTASAAQALDAAGAGVKPALLDAVKGGWDEVGVTATPGAFQNPALIAALDEKRTGFA